MGTILSLLATDVLDTTQDTPWAANIQQFCETAADVCVQEYDPDSFFNSAHSRSSNSSIQPELHAVPSRHLFAQSSTSELRD